RLGAPPERERLHRLRGQLHPPRLPGQLAGRGRPVPLPLPRRRLLRRRAGRRRAAAESAAALPGPGRERGRPSADPAAADHLVIRVAYRWLDDRLGISSAIMPVVEHPVPRSINWWYVLGSATLVAFTVQVVTGVALAFSYVPAPNSAYESLTFITNTAVLGHVVRGIHYYGSSAMVVLISLHLARTFLIGAFKFPRELHELTGVFLFALTL